MKDNSAIEYGETDGRFLRDDGARRLAGRVAVVIGGGQTDGRTTGNGKAAALVYAKEGASVVVVDKILPAAEATANAIRSNGGTALALCADVTSEDNVRMAVARSLDTYGQIDILHNNVGAGSSLGDSFDIADFDPDAFDRVMSLNLKSMMLTAKHVLPTMRERRSGVIINISSFVVYTSKGSTVYRASKAGAIVLTRQLAISNAEYNIRANAVLPGQINTPMAIEHQVEEAGGEDHRAAVVAGRDAQVPLGHRQGTAWDVAYASLFLASDEARFITGESLLVDGGQSLRVG